MEEDLYRAAHESIEEIIVKMKPIKQSEVEPHITKTEKGKPNIVIDDE